MRRRRPRGGGRGGERLFAWRAIGAAKGGAGPIGLMRLAHCRRWLPALGGVPGNWGSRSRPPILRLAPVAGTPVHAEMLGAGGRIGRVITFQRGRPQSARRTPVNRRRPRSLAMVWGGG